MPEGRQCTHHNFLQRWPANSHALSEARKESLMDKAKGLLHHHHGKDGEQHPGAQQQEQQQHAQKGESELDKVEDYVKRSQAQEAEDQAEGNEYGKLM